MNNLNKNDKQLAIIAGGNEFTYGKRKEALDNIKNFDILNDLAVNAQDDWIRLEAAIFCQNEEVLIQLANEGNEGIRLEAAIELKNDKILAEIALSGSELFFGSMAVGYISDPKLLLKIIAHSKFERLKAEAALKLGDKLLINKLTDKITDEWIKFRLASSVGNIEILAELAKKSDDKKIKALACEWLEDIIYECDTKTDSLQKIKNVKTFVN